MWLDVQDALVAHLQAQQAPGGRLEGIQTVRSGADDTSYDLDYPLVTVSAADTFSVEGTAAQVELRFEFEVAVFALNADGADSAERALQALVWSGRGAASTGVLPALLALMKRDLVAGGATYRVRATGQPRLGFAAQKSEWVAGLVIPVTVLRTESTPL